MQKKVFVTGASGYLGKELIKQLSKLPIEIFCLVRPTSNVADIASPRITLIKGSIEDNASYGSALKGADEVIHCAALVSNDNKELNFKTNVDGTKQLIEAMKKHGVKRCVYVSTISAGFPRRSHYAESKLQAERLLLLSGIPTTVVRFNLIIGINSPMLDKIVSFAKLPVIPVVGSGKKLIQPITVQDVASIVIQAVHHEETAQRTYTISGKDIVSYNDFLDKITETFAGKKKMKFHIPILVCSLMAFGFQFLKNPPITKGQIILINQDAVSSLGDLKKSFSFEPKPLVQILEEAKP